MNNPGRTCEYCSQCDPQEGCEYFYELDAEDALIACENFTSMEDDDDALLNERFPQRRVKRHCAGETVFCP